MTTPDNDQVKRAIRTLLPGLRSANYDERWHKNSPAVAALTILCEYVGEPVDQAGDLVDPHVESHIPRRPEGDPLTVYEVLIPEPDGDQGFGTYASKEVAERVRDKINAGFVGTDQEGRQAEVWPIQVDTAEPVVEMVYTLGFAAKRAAHFLRWRAEPHVLINLNPGQSAPALEVTESEWSIEFRGTDRDAVIAEFTQRARAAGVLDERGES